MKYVELDENSAAFLVKIFSNPEYDLYFAENETTEEQWKERFVYFADKKSHIIYKGTSPVGWIMYEVKETVCNIDIIVLLDEERHKGYGQEIIHDIIEKNEGLRAIKLDVQKRNIAACKFYEKMGFRVVDTEQQPVGDGIEDYYKLQLDI